MQTHRRPDSWMERRERRKVNLAAIASRSDGTEIPVRLLNISYEGCQLATEKPLVVGERIKLGLTGLGEMVAEVRWTSKYRAGARFALELPLLAEKRRYSLGPFFVAKWRPLSTHFGHSPRIRWPGTASAEDEHGNVLETVRFADAVKIEA